MNYKRLSYLLRFNLGVLVFLASCNTHQLGFEEKEHENTEEEEYKNTYEYSDISFEELREMSSDDLDDDQRAAAHSAANRIAERFRGRSFTEHELQAAAREEAMGILGLQEDQDRHRQGLEEDQARQGGIWGAIWNLILNALIQLIISIVKLILGL